MKINLKGMTAAGALVLAIGGGALGGALVSSHHDTTPPAVSTIHQVDDASSAAPVASVPAQPKAKAAPVIVHKAPKAKAADVVAPAESDPAPVAPVADPAPVASADPMPVSQTTGRDTSEDQCTEGATTATQECDLDRSTGVYRWTNKPVVTPTQPVHAAPPAELQ